MDIPDPMAHLEEGRAPQGAAAAIAWLNGHGNRLGPFIGSSFAASRDEVEVLNPANGAHLAWLAAATPGEIDAAVTGARSALAAWASLPGTARAAHLAALAAAMHTMAACFSELATLATGQTIRESRARDLPLAVATIARVATLARTCPDEWPGLGPHGVCGVIAAEPPTLGALARAVVLPLAAGNTVVLAPAAEACLPALLLSETACTAGLPAGVLNVVTGQEAATLLAGHPGLDHLAFFGTEEDARGPAAAAAAAGRAMTGTPVTPGRFILLDDADQDAAAEDLARAIWAGKIAGAGMQLLVQEGVADTFHTRLRTAMARLRAGDPLDRNTDIGPCSSFTEMSRLQATDMQGGEVHGYEGAMPEGGAYIPPMIVTGLSPADPLMQAQRTGPILPSTTFRSPTEALHLINALPHRPDISLWTESLTTALQIAPHLRAGTVRVNAVKIGAPFLPDGGDALLPHLRLRAPASVSRHAAPSTGAGQFDCPDIAEAARKVRKAQTGWAATPTPDRADTLFAIADAVSAQRAALSDALRASGVETDRAEAEIDQTVARFLLCARLATETEGRARRVEGGLLLEVRTPRGVIGMLCPVSAALAGPMAMLAPALAAGNGGLLVPSATQPGLTAILQHCLVDGGLPAGLVGIVAGPQDALAAPLARCAEIDAIWCAAGPDVARQVAQAALPEFKHVLALPALTGNVPPKDGENRALTGAASDLTSIWLPG